MKNKKLKFEKPKKDKPIGGERYNWIYWDEIGVMGDNSIIDRYKVNKDKLKK